MLSKFAISISLTACICAPFYMPYTRSRSISRRDHQWVLDRYDKEYLDAQVIL